jgi:hypothetical protein
MVKKLSSTETTYLETISVKDEVRAVRNETKKRYKALNGPDATRFPYPKGKGTKKNMVIWLMGHPASGKKSKKKSATKTKKKSATKTKKKSATKTKKKSATKTKKKSATKAAKRKYEKNAKYPSGECKNVKSIYRLDCLYRQIKHRKTLKKPGFTKTGPIPPGRRSFHKANRWLGRYGRHANPKVGTNKPRAKTKKKRKTKK